MNLEHSKFSFKAVLSTLILIFALAVPSYNAKADVAPVRNQEKVQLYYNDISYIYHGTTRDIIYIKVANSIASPEVSVNYKYAYYAWTDTTATFYQKLDDNYSIYKAEVVGSGELKYSINIKNDKEAYFDDNKGLYYSNDERLGAANVTPIRTYGGLGSEYYSVRVAVKNLGFNKDVKVRYTVDNWKTYKDASLKFEHSTDNYEVWSGYLDSRGGKADTFRYAVSYTVNGQTYWDNNFGNNYDLSFNNYN